MTARSGTSCRADVRHRYEREYGKTTHRGGTVPSWATARWGRRRRCCWRAGAYRSSLLDARAERDPIGSKAICQQRDVLEVWDAIGVGRQIADEGVTWTVRPHLPPRPRTVRADVRRPRHLAVPAVRQHLPGADRGTARRADRGHAARSTCGGDTRPRRSTRTSRRDRHLSHAPVTARSSRLRRGRRRGRGAARPRRQLGRHVRRSLFDDKFLICDIGADIPGWADERRFYFDPEWNPGRQVLIHPCPDSTFRIDWQVPGEYDLEAEEQSGALDARIRKIIGDDRLRDRVEIGVPLPLPGRGPDAGRPGAARRRRRAPRVPVRGARPELRRRRRRERRVEARVRPAGLGRRVAARELPRRAARGGRARTSTVTTATMDFLVPQYRGRAPAPAGRAARGGHRPAGPGARRLRPSRRAVLVRRITLDHTDPERPVHRAPRAAAAPSRRRRESSCPTPR